MNQLRFPAAATWKRLRWTAPFLVVGFFLMFRRGGRVSDGMETRNGFPRYAGVLMLMLLLPALFLGFFFLQFLAQTQSPSVVAGFHFFPAGVSNNIVIVAINAEIRPGSAQLRAVLKGPRLSTATEEAFSEAFFPAFPGTLIKPMPNARNQPGHMLPPGRHTWRLGFVLPDATLAKEAFENLPPIGTLRAVPGRTMARTLFEVGQANGEKFHATLQVALPLTAADSNWVSVSGQSMNSESALTLTWDVLRRNRARRGSSMRTAALPHSFNRSKR